MTEWALQQGDYLLRVVVAGLCGLLIGCERTARMKMAGIRTHTIIAMAAAVMVVISKYGFFDVLTSDSIKLDPSRVAAGVVSGIGFLGAGIILNRKTSVSGVTTSAGIWATLGIGMAIGAGMWVLGIGTTLILLVVQYLFHKNLWIFNTSTNIGQIHLHLQQGADNLDRLVDSLNEMNIQVTSKSISLTDDGSMTATLQIQATHIFEQDDLLHLMQRHPEITSVDF